MGPLVLGQPFADAIAEIPGAENACGHAYSASDLELWIAGWPTSLDGPPGPLGVALWGVGPAELVGGGPRTPEGIGIGSTEAQVRAQYPDVTEVYRQGLNLRTGNVFFAIDPISPVVTAIGVTNDDIPYEFCS